MRCIAGNRMAGAGCGNRSSWKQEIDPLDVLCSSGCKHLRLNNTCMIFFVPSIIIYERTCVSIGVSSLFSPSRLFPVSTRPRNDAAPSIHRASQVCLCNGGSHFKTVKNNFDVSLLSGYPRSFTLVSKVID